jgi:hypothetical protein
LNEAALNYLKEVLGIEWLPLKAMEGSRTEAGEVPVPAAKKILVVVSQPFTQPDQVLLDRMMKAIQISDYTVSSEICESPGVGLILCSEVAGLRGFKTHGEVQTIGQRRAIFTHSLQEMREGPAALVQQRKKSAWAHLQTMRSWLEEDV